MRAMVAIGIVLIVLGVVALVHPDIPYKSERDVIRVGPVQTSIETRRTIAVPPVAAGLVLAGGVGLVVAGVRKKA